MNTLRGPSIVAGLPGIIDVVRDLGCSTAAGFTTNASKLNALKYDRTKEKTWMFPCGQYEFTETWATGIRTGGHYCGSGGISRDLENSHYGGTTDPALYGGSVTRLIWKGNTTSPLLQLNNSGSHVHNLQIQSATITAATIDGNQLKIGIHINTTNGAGAGSIGSKCRLDHLSFVYVHTDILVGTSLTATGASYDDFIADGNAGEEAFDDHAESITAGDIHSYALFDGANAGSVVHIRNEQAVSHTFQNILSHGDKAQAVYLERGGKTFIGLISIAASPAATIAALRVGLMNVNQGAINVGHISLDATSLVARLLVMDDLGSNATGTQVINIGSALIPPDNAAPIIVDARSGVINLSNVWGLRTGTVKLTGYVSGAFKHVCNINLNNCTLYGDWPDLLIHSASAGPYRLTWKNCVQITQGDGLNWHGRPFADGEFSRNTSSGTTPIATLNCIKDQLAAYWKLDEASGNRADSYGGNTLTDNNTVGSTTGKISNAAQFVVANNESLSVASTADLVIGNADASLSFWFQLAAKVANQNIVAKTAAGDGEFFFFYDQPSDRMKFTVHGAAGFGSTTTITANVLGSPATSTWYHVACYHDSINNQIGLWINGVAETPATHTLGVYSTSGAFSLGDFQFTSEFGGLLDEVGFWRRVITPREIVALYNGGSGLAYPLTY